MLRIYASNTVGDEGEEHSRLPGGRVARVG